jgi:hypothetical protein
VSYILHLKIKIHYKFQRNYQTKNQLNWIVILKMYMCNKFHNEITQLYNKVIMHDIWKNVNMGQKNYKWNQFETQLNFGAFYFLDEI